MQSHLQDNPLGDDDQGDVDDDDRAERTFNKRPTPQPDAKPTKRSTRSSNSATAADDAAARVPQHPPDTGVAMLHR